MDFNATTPLDPQVVEAISKSLIENWSNPSSLSAQGKEAKKQINESRKSIANMINANCPSDIIFVSGGTEVKILLIIQKKFL